MVAVIVTQRRLSSQLLEGTGGQMKWLRMFGVAVFVALVTAVFILGVGATIMLISKKAGF